MAANGGHKNDLFRACLPEISFSYNGGRYVPDMGSEAHCEEMFDAMDVSTMITNIGEKSKANRWFQSTRNWRAIEPVLGMLLYLITYMGMILAWWKEFDATPIAKLMNRGDAQMVLHDEWEQVMEALQDEQAAMTIEESISCN